MFRRMRSTFCLIGQIFQPESTQFWSRQTTRATVLWTRRKIFRPGSTESILNESKARRQNLSYSKPENLPNWGTGRSFSAYARNSMNSQDTTSNVRNSRRSSRGKEAHHPIFLLLRLPVPIHPRLCIGRESSTSRNFRLQRVPSSLGKEALLGTVSSTNLLLCGLALRAPVHSEENLRTPQIWFDSQSNPDRTCENRKGSVDVLRNPEEYLPNSSDPCPYSV